MGEGNSCIGQARLDIAAIVNQHTQNLLSYQERDLPWNIEQPQIVIEARDGTEALYKAGLRCPDAQDDVIQGVRLLMENAKSAYKDTLYLHEWFDEDLFIAETTPDCLKSSSIETELRNHSYIREDGDIAIKVDSVMLAGSAGALAIGKFLSRGCSFLRIIGAGYRAAGIIGLTISIAGDLMQAGSFIYMKATNPDLRFMTVEE